MRDPGDTDSGASEPAATIARLERRAARERAARIEAEVIAETQLRGAYERAREVELLAAISGVVNEADDFGKALSAAAKAVRRHCGFAVAHVLVPAEDGALVTSDIWDADGDRLAFLDLVLTATDDQRFPVGVGLPGQVAASHLAVWLPDLSLVGDFPRKTIIRSGSAWAFPVISGVEVVAVFEFIDPSPRAADDRLLALAPSLAGQLAHASEWERLRRREVEDRARLEALVSSQAAALVAAQREGAAIGNARLALISYLAHESQRCADEISGSSLVPVDSPAVERLHDVASRLILAAEAPDRRLAGLREAVRPETMVRDLLVSPTLGLVHPPDVVVAPVAAREFELNKSLVERVLHSVLALACQHSDEGSDRIEIDWDDGLLVVRVLDRGAEFAWPDGPSTTPRGEELTQVSRLVTALGGTLTVRPREPEGTVVEVRLAARSGQLGLASSDADGEARRVLVVDDNSINRRLAAAMLGRAGLEADVVESGTEALDAMAERRYGLVLMDIGMPGLDGRQTTRVWRGGVAESATSRDVPIVALTAHVGQDERDACAESGMDDYLSKPFGIEALASMCRRWMPTDQAGSGEAR